MSNVQKKTAPYPFGPRPVHEMFLGIGAEVEVLRNSRGILEF